MTVAHRLFTLAGLAITGVAVAQPAFVGHTPTQQVFGEPSGITGREPDAVRVSEGVDLWAKIGPSFSYDVVLVYYTIDGTNPSGANGVPNNTSTRVIRSSTNPTQFAFVRNQPNGFGGNDDWWRVRITDFDAREYGRTIKYRIAAWKNGPGGLPQGELNTNVFEYRVLAAWPGAGFGQPLPALGYPPVKFWKEEAFIGNTFTAAMLDQNGTLWDMYFPTPGGVQGVGTKNEGYSEGPDTFPGGLTPEKRGQMHLNQAMVGIRSDNDGVTHWLSNPNGVSFNNIQQSYLSDTTNTVATSQTLFANGNNISVTQTDFAPAGIDFPDGLAGTGEQKHMLVKRMTLRNNLPAAQDVTIYYYMDPALNGGDDYDFMFWDAARGAMTAFDKTTRTVTGTGPFITPPNEYNITTFSGYQKNIALYLTAAMKVNGQPANETWRDTSADQSQGWIARRVTLPPNVDVNVEILMAGAHFRPEPITAPMPGSDGVYDNEIVPMLDWFYTSDMAAIQSTTDTYWANWLNKGVTLDAPDDRFDRLMKRGLLGTALHQDGVFGGIVAGYHNGAYYYVWPRDAMWAAVTLARTGHFTEARKAIDWMRDTSYRDFEPWGRKGFWKQKCTTDGFTVWGAPQIDGTAVFPWAVQFLDNLQADTAYLNLNYPAVRDSVLAMTTDSSDSRLRWEEAFNLTYSNNLWEDSYDTFIYSNANMHRGLVDAGKIANTLGFTSDANDAFTRASWVKSGLDGRLNWDGENTDISQLGIVYPFEVYSPTDFKSVRVIDRINGVRRKFNNAHPTAEPLVNFAGFPNDQYGWTDLINRYWGDGYWGGGTPHGAGPWFLTTMWYGAYYAMRQDFTPGTGDIDNHKYRLNLLLDRVGPMGLGAEQIGARFADNSRPGSLLYPGQNDFVLQTAWPNAWESMSFFTDSLMLFLDYSPSARTNTMNFEPKLPSAWNTMTFNNVRMQPSPVAPVHSIDVTVSRDAFGETHTFTNDLGVALNVGTVIRANPGLPIRSVTRNDIAHPYTFDPATGRVTIAANPLESGTPGVTTTYRVQYNICDNIDFNNNGVFPEDQDTFDFFEVLAGGTPATCDPVLGCNDIDFNNNGVFPEDADVVAFFNILAGGDCTE